MRNFSLLPFAEQGFSSHAKDFTQIKVAVPLRRMETSTLAP
jgi:hypothetical protein